MEGGGEGPGNALGHAWCPQGNLEVSVFPLLQASPSPGTCFCPEETWPSGPAFYLYPEFCYLLLFWAMPQEPLSDTYKPCHI